MKRLAMAMSVLMLVGMVSVAQAADDPTGTWKWTVMMGNQGQAREQTLRLKLEGDKLTGAMVGRNDRETAIEEGAYKDGTVSFQVTRERQGQKIVTKYQGKVSGDTIKGTQTFGRDGQQRERPWEAKRASS